MKYEYLDHNIRLSIKNKSGKRRLSRGGGLTSKTPSDPFVYCDFFHSCNFSIENNYYFQIHWKKVWQPISLLQVNWLPKPAVLTGYNKTILTD